MRITRIIEVFGPESWVRETIKRSLGDGDHAFRNQGDPSSPGFFDGDRRPISSGPPTPNEKAERGVRVRTVRGDFEDPVAREAAISIWHAKTFPNATIADVYRKLLEEVGEIGQALVNAAEHGKPKNDLALLYEIGDAGIALSGLASKLGASLDAAIAGVWEIRRDRPEPPTPKEIADRLWNAIENDLAKDESPYDRDSFRLLVGSALGPYFSPRAIREKMKQAGETE